MAAQFGPIADAIVADLNSPSPAWPTAVAAQRNYLTMALLESLTAFTCVVTPVRRPTSLASKGMLNNGPAYIFAFVQKFDAPPNSATVDSLIATVEAVQDAYAKSKTQLTVPGVGLAYSMSADLDPAYDPSLLDEQFLFYSMLAVEMGVWHS